MKIDILTLFPEMFDVRKGADDNSFGGPFGTSLLRKAQEKGILDINLHQIRDWSGDNYGTVDDSPYGGGVGMVLKVDVIDRALADIKATNPELTPHILLMTPQGQALQQAKVKELAKKEWIILIAGHYEGYDERIRSLVDEEISIGDYVLTGGELPAMIVVDAVSRYLPGVLGKLESAQEESFSQESDELLLEYPQYTRPEAYIPKSKESEELRVPEILLSGHHANIIEWRKQQAKERTKNRRPDLLKNN